MSAGEECRPFVRPLYDWEVIEARRVFGDRIHYPSVRIHECSRWTNGLDRVGRMLKRMPGDSHNTAMTIGNHCFFPVNLPQWLVRPGDPEYYKLPWLIHELTHVWQYQHLGWRYILMALMAQFRLKAAAYDFGHADGLQRRRGEGWTIHRYNLEQQGDIARSYYERLAKGEDVTVWASYIADIRGGDVDEGPRYA